MAAIHDWQAVKDIWSKRLEGKHEGFFITLDTSHTLTGIGDFRVPNWQIKLDSACDYLAHQIRQYCLGKHYRKHNRTENMLILSAFEIGRKNGLVHAHMIAVHDNATDRSVENMLGFVSRKWAAISNPKLKTNAVDVIPIDNAHIPIGYIAKQTEQYQRRWNGAMNICMY